MENKRIFKIVLTGIMICGLFTTAMAKDILDVLDLSLIHI